MTPELTLAASRLSTLLEDQRISFDCSDEALTEEIIVAMAQLKFTLGSTAKRDEIIYLAAPYTHTDPAVRAQRADAITQIAAALAAVKGFCVYSPITHGVGMQAHLPPDVELCHDFWMRQCLPLLRASTRMLIIPLPGWQESQGIKREMREAESLGIPIGLMQHDEIASLITDLALLTRRSEVTA